MTWWCFAVAALDGHAKAYFWNRILVTKKRNKKLCRTFLINRFPFLLFFRIVSYTLITQSLPATTFLFIMSANTLSTVEALLPSIATLTSQNTELLKIDYKGDRSSDSNLSPSDSTSSEAPPISTSTSPSPPYVGLDLQRQQQRPDNVPHENNSALISASNESTSEKQKMAVIPMPTKPRARYISVRDPECIYAIQCLVDAVRLYPRRNSNQFSKECLDMAAAQWRLWQQENHRQVDASVNLIRSHYHNKMNEFATWRKRASNPANRIVNDRVFFKDCHGRFRSAKRLPQELEILINELHKSLPRPGYKKKKMTQEELVLLQKRVELQSRANDKFDARSNLTGPDTANTGHQATSTTGHLTLQYYSQSSHQQMQQPQQQRSQLPQLQLAQSHSYYTQHQQLPRPMHQQKHILESSSYRVSETDRDDEPTASFQYPQYHTKRQPYQSSQLSPLRSLTGNQFQLRDLSTSSNSDHLYSSLLGTASTSLNRPATSSSSSDNLFSSLLRSDNHMPNNSSRSPDGRNKNALESQIHSLQTLQPLLLGHSTPHPFVKSHQGMTSNAVAIASAAADGAGTSHHNTPSPITPPPASSPMQKDSTASRYLCDSRYNYDQREPQLESQSRLQTQPKQQRRQLQNTEYIQGWKKKYIKWGFRCKCIIVNVIRGLCLSFAEGANIPPAPCTVSFPTRTLDLSFRSLRSSWQAAANTKANEILS